MPNVCICCFVCCLIVFVIVRRVSHRWQQPFIRQYLRAGLSCVCAALFMLRLLFVLCSLLQYIKWCFRCCFYSMASACTIVFLLHFLYLRTKQLHQPQQKHTIHNTYTNLLWLAVVFEYDDCTAFDTPRRGAQCARFAVENERTHDKWIDKTRKGKGLHEHGFVPIQHRQVVRLCDTRINIANTMC